MKLRCKKCGKEYEDFCKCLRGVTDDIGPCCVEDWEGKKLYFNEDGTPKYTCNS